MFESIPRLTADFSYVRIMGERDLESFDRIHRHRDDVLEQWTSAIDLLHAANVFIYVDNYFEGFAPETANKLQRLLNVPISHAELQQEQPSLF